jgi:hypothetical protein
METLLPVVAASNVAVKPESLASDLVYQCMTIVAMLWLLASLWVF